MYLANGIYLFPVALAGLFFVFTPKTILPLLLQYIHGPCTLKLGFVREFKGKSGTKLAFSSHFGEGRIVSKTILFWRIQYLKEIPLHSLMLIDVHQSAVSLFSTSVSRSTIRFICST